MPHGHGIYTYGPNSKLNGEQYDGEYLNGIRNGRGNYLFGNRDRYDGNLAMDKFNA